MGTRGWDEGVAYLVCIRCPNKEFYIVRGWAVRCACMWQRFIPVNTGLCYRCSKCSRAFAVDRNQTSAFFCRTSSTNLRHDVVTSSPRLYHVFVTYSPLLHHVFVTSSPRLSTSSSRLPRMFVTSSLRLHHAFTTSLVRRQRCKPGSSGFQDNTLVRSTTALRSAIVAAGQAWAS